MTRNLFTLRYFYFLLLTVPYLATGGLVPYPLALPYPGVLYPTGGLDPYPTGLAGYLTGGLVPYPGLGGWPYLTGGLVPYPGLGGWPYPYPNPPGLVVQLTEVLIWHTVFRAVVQLVQVFFVGQHVCAVHLGQTSLYVVQVNLTSGEVTVTTLVVPIVVQIVVVVVVFGAVLVTVVVAVFVQPPLSGVGP